MISFAKLPVRAAIYHWRGTLPVLLGVAVGAAALTGALLVGDSLRGSLRERSQRQLNGVVSAYFGPRLVRAELAGAVPGATPALILSASAESDAGRVGRATVYGFDATGFERFGIPDPGGRGAVLSKPVADRLRLKAGDSVRIGVEKLTAVPRSSVLGRRGLDDVTETFSIPVAAVLPAGHAANELSLQPTPAAPTPLFLPLALLQERVGRPGRINAILSSEAVPADALAGQLTLADWGLSAEVAPTRKVYVSLESDSLVVSPQAVNAAKEAAKATGGRAAETIAYLANALTADATPLPNADAGVGRKLIPYSVVCALDVDAAPPLGPFLPPGAKSLGDDEIILVDWDQSPLKGLPAGSPVTVNYFKPELEAGTEEAAKTFTLKGYLPMTGVAADPGLTPKFPGVTDKLSIGDWNLPFPLTSARIQKRDENYWERSKATPKAYLTLAAGKRLFGSRFGSDTSVRVAPPRDTPIEAYRETFRSELLAKLDPVAGGLVVRPVRQEVLAASKGGTDFAGLFLAFSGLLILAALILVGLLFRLAIERRAKELGVLLAAGYSPRQVRRLLLAEGMGVAVAGTLFGMLLASLYAGRMIAVLVAEWPDNLVGGYFHFHAQPLSFVIGFVATLGVSLVTIWLTLRGLAKVPPAALLRGATAVADAGPVVTEPRRWPLVVAGLLAVVGVGSLIYGGQVSNPDYRSGAFFGGGLMLLVAAMLAGRGLLRRLARPGVSQPSLPRLGVRYAARSAPRTLLTASMVALAAFLVVAVESFRRRPDAEFATKSGGSGGFALIAEADVPIARPFDAGPGRDDLAERFEKLAQTKPPAERNELLAEADADLKGIDVIGLPLQGGDDASCLNLYQAGRPRVAGVPDALISRGAFRFGDTLAETPEEKANPWLLLKKPLPGGAVPVIAEQNTAMFMLKTGIGGSVTLTDGEGRAAPGVIVALLQDSLFQSELLVSQADFRRLYPRQEGSRLFLIDAPAGSAERVASRLEQGLAANGFMATTATAKVARYQAVVGAYLTTFQLLGILALLLAVLGVGVVILRGVWERGGEFALLRAVGYSAGQLRSITLAETGAVLTLGLGAGIGAAVISVLPNQFLGGSVPILFVIKLLLLVTVTALAVAALAVWQVSRLGVVPSLRRE